MHNLNMSAYGGVIAAEITDAQSNARPAGSQDAEASLRAELAAKISSAESELERALVPLRAQAARGGDATALTRALAQSHLLASLEKRLPTLDATGLAAIHDEVVAITSVARAVAESTSSVSLTSEVQAELTAASADAHRTVGGFMRDYFERRIFDPYLRFNSVEDEEEYRKREEERHRQIEQAHAEQTPDGELRALNLSIDQMKDAGAHGADQSPEFKSRYDELIQQRDRLSGVIKKSTATKDAPPPKAEDIAPARPASVTPDAMASLRAAGVMIADQNKDGHGVTSAASPGASRGLT